MKDFSLMGKFLQLSRSGAQLALHRLSIRAGGAQEKAIARHGRPFNVRDNMSTD
jgi:hypothetical protein